MTLEDIQRVLLTAECPFCSAKNFDLKLRCDLDASRCLPTARCRQCGYEFDAEQLIHSFIHDSGRRLTDGEFLR